FVVTTTLPVAAPAGTTATIEVALQLVIEVAAVPLNATVLDPCVAPKFVPVIVTDVPTAPELGTRDVIDGGTVTVKVTPLLGAFVVTTTLPVVAPAGTMTTIEVALQLVIEVAPVSLNATVLDPCVAPKFVPVIVTEVPTAPEVGASDVIDGGTVTVKVTPLLGALVVTTTLPVVAPAG